MSGHFGRTILVCDGYVKYHLNQKKGVFISQMDTQTTKKLTRRDQDLIVEACVSLERKLRRLGYNGKDPKFPF